MCKWCFIQGMQLKRYVIQETTENRVTFYFRSPREGNYYITVFAQQVLDSGIHISEFMFYWALFF